MSKFVVNLTWQDAPHLTKEAQEELLASYSPHERDARSKGQPQLGSGAIYPVVEDEVLIDTFSIPDKWPRAYGMDVGYDHPTAVIWGAYDQKSDIWYLYSEYKQGKVQPAIHADAIRSRGIWVPGIIDQHSNRRSEAGEISLLTMYERLGLNVSTADNGPGTVEPSILEIYQRLSSGRLKIMKHLLRWREEFRIYRRDEKGAIVKKDDDLMDATRYLVMNGRQIAEQPPLDELEDSPLRQSNNQGRSSICGY